MQLEHPRHKAAVSFARRLVELSADEHPDLEISEAIMQTWQKHGPDLGLQSREAEVMEEILESTGDLVLDSSGSLDAVVSHIADQLFERQDTFTTARLRELRGFLGPWVTGTVLG